MSNRVETAKKSDPGRIERASQFKAWGTDLVCKSGISEALEIWWDDWDGYVGHDDQLLTIMLNPRFFLAAEIPVSMLRPLLAHEVGHAWSKTFSSRANMSDEEIDADDFAARATCGHCLAGSVQLYHDFYSALGETFATASKTHLGLADRIARIRETFGDLGYCTCS